MQKNTCQHAAPSPDGVFGCPDSWVYCTPGSSDSSAHLDLRLSVWMFAAGRMVLLFFLGSHGTLVAVSAPSMMPLRDSDIPMNVPFTFSNKQPLTPWCKANPKDNGISWWIGSSPRTTFAGNANAHIMTIIVECVRERVMRGARTFMVTPHAHSWSR